MSNSDSKTTEPLAYLEQRVRDLDEAFVGVQAEIGQAAPPAGEYRKIYIGLVGQAGGEQAVNDKETTDDAAIRQLAERMAQEHDVHVSRAEAAIRNLIERGLIEVCDGNS